MSFWEKEEVSDTEILQHVVASFAKESFRDGAWAKPKRPEVLADVQRRLTDEISLRVEFLDELQECRKFVGRGRGGHGPAHGAPYGGQHVDIPLYAPLVAKATTTAPKPALALSPHQSFGKN